jgi:hypothetical protein
MTEKIQIIHKQTKQIRVPLFYMILFVFVMGTMYLSSLSVNQNGFTVIEDEGYMSLRDYKAFQVTLRNKKTYYLNDTSNWYGDFEALSNQINQINDSSDNQLLHNTSEKIYIPTVDTLLDVYPGMSQRVDVNRLKKRYLQAPHYLFGDYLGYVTDSEEINGGTYKDDRGNVLTVQNVTPSTMLVFTFLGQLNGDKIAFALKNIFDKADSLDRQTSICYIRQYKSLLFFTHNELIVELV